MTANARVLARARTLIGVRFRLHGRDPASGLDCVGLAATCLAAGGRLGAVPNGYALRSGDAARVAQAIRTAGLVPAERCTPGDLMLFRAGPGQLHLGIASEAGVIHADAMLRRVVERPAPDWPVIGCWRLPEEA